MTRKIEVLENSWYGHGTGSMAKPAFTIRLAEPKSESDRNYLRHGEAATPTIIATLDESECPVDLEFLAADCPVLIYEPQGNDDDHENSERDYEWCKSLVTNAN